MPVTLVAKRATPLGAAPAAVSVITGGSDLQLHQLESRAVRARLANGEAPLFAAQLER